MKFKKVEEIFVVRTVLAVLLCSLLVFSVHAMQNEDRIDGNNSASFWAAQGFVGGLPTGVMLAKYLVADESNTTISFASFFGSGLATVCCVCVSDRNKAALIAGYSAGLFVGTGMHLLEKK